MPLIEARGKKGRREEGGLLSETSSVMGGEGGAMSVH